jgi:hypothetical protein
MYGAQRCRAKRAPSFTPARETLDPELVEKLAGVYLTPARVKSQVLYQPGVDPTLTSVGGLV